MIEMQNEGWPGSKRTHSHEERGKSIMLARELEVASIIGLWLEIHGGDPPETQDEVAAIAGQIIANLATVAFGQGSEVSAEAITSRLGQLNVRVQQGGNGGASAGGSGITPDAMIVHAGRYNEIVWPGVPGGPPIIVKVPVATLT